MDLVETSTNKKYLFVGVVIGAIVSFVATLYLASIAVSNVESELKSSQDKFNFYKKHVDITLMRHLDNNFKFVLSFARENPDSKTLAILSNEIQEHNALSPLVSNRDWFARSMLFMLVKAHELSEITNQGDPENIIELAKSACEKINPMPKSCDIVDLREMLVAFDKEDSNYIAEYFGTKDKTD